MRLSRACIPVLLVPGNHDISPSLGRAHALQEYETLDPDYIHVVSRPELYKPEQLNDVQAQVIAIPPWITRHNVKAMMQDQSDDDIDPNMQIEQALADWLEETIADLDDDLPTILTAHASVLALSLATNKTLKSVKTLSCRPVS